MGVLEDLKPNVGVFTDSAHNLWVAEAEPKAEALQGEETLKEGDALIEIKRTGICGCAVSGEVMPDADVRLDQMFMSGMLAAKGPSWWKTTTS